MWIFKHSCRRAGIRKWQPFSLIGTSWRNTAEMKVVNYITSEATESYGFGLDALGHRAQLVYIATISKITPLTNLNPREQTAPPPWLKCFSSSCVNSPFSPFDSVPSRRPLTCILLALYNPATGCGGERMVRFCLIIEHDGHIWIKPEPTAEPQQIKSAVPFVD